MNNRRDLNGELLTVKKDVRSLSCFASCSTLAMRELSLPASASEILQLMQSCNSFEMPILQRQVAFMEQGWGNEELIENLTCELEQNFELTSAIDRKVLQVIALPFTKTKKEDIRTRYHFGQPHRMRI